MFLFRPLILSYYKIGTAGPTDSEFVATKTRVFFNLTGTPDKPVKDITIRGLEMRDARLTYLDAHGMPSGGDWALQRSGVVFMQGTEGITVDSNDFVRNDGNAVFLSAYNRNATISNNDVSWNGDTAFVSGLYFILKHHSFSFQSSSPFFD